MPAVSFLGAMSTGHGSWPPRPSTEGDDSFLINGIPVLCVGDAFAVHCNPALVCHGGTVSAGCNSFLINNQPAARIGDPVSCGDAVAIGDPSFFATD